MALQRLTTISRADSRWPGVRVPPQSGQIVTEGVVDQRDSGALRGVLEHVVFWIAVLFLATSGVIVTVLGLLVAPVLTRRTRARIGQGFLHRWFRHYFRALEATGLFEFDLDALAAVRELSPRVLAANHPALLDAMLVAARVPNVVGIMKADVRLSPVYAGSALMAGYARADRPIEMIHTMVRAIESGQHVLVFPESTRTVRVPVNPFKGNFALIAKQAGVPVQTLLIETDSPYLRKGWPLFRKPPMPVRFRVRVGQSFPATGDVKATLRAVESYFRAELSGERGDRGEPGALPAPAADEVST